MEIELLWKDLDNIGFRELDDVIDILDSVIGYTFINEFYDSKEVISIIA